MTAPAQFFDDLPTGSLRPALAFLVFWTTMASLVSGAMSPAFHRLLAEPDVDGKSALAIAGIVLATMGPAYVVTMLVFVGLTVGAGAVLSFFSARVGGQRDTRAAACVVAFSFAPSVLHVVPGIGWAVTLYMYYLKVVGVGRVLSLTGGGRSLSWRSLRQPSECSMWCRRCGIGCSDRTTRRTGQDQLLPAGGVTDGAERASDSTR